MGEGASLVEKYASRVNALRFDIGEVLKSGLLGAEWHALYSSWARYDTVRMA